MSLEFRLPRALREATFPEDAHLFWELVQGLTALTRAAKENRWATGNQEFSAPEVEGIIQELTGLLRQKHAEDYLPKVEGRKIEDLGEITLENWEVQIREAMKIILSQNEMGKRDGRSVTVAYVDAIRLHRLLADVIGIRFYRATINPSLGEEGSPPMRQTIEHLTGLKYVNNGGRKDLVTQMFDRLWSKANDNGERHISRIAAEIPEGRKRSSEIFYGFSSPAAPGRVDEYELAIKHLESVGFRRSWLNEFKSLVKTEDHLLPYRLPQWTWGEIKDLRPEEYERQVKLAETRAVV